MFSLRGEKKKRKKTKKNGNLWLPIMYLRMLYNWCPYVMINVSIQCNGGLLPDIILLTICDSIGEPF